MTNSLHHLPPSTLPTLPSAHSFPPSTIPPPPILVHPPPRPPSPLSSLVTSTLPLLRLLPSLTSTSPLLCLYPPDPALRRFPLPGPRASPPRPLLSLDPCLCSVSSPTSPLPHLYRASAPHPALTPTFSLYRASTPPLPCPPFSLCRACAPNRARAPDGAHVSAWGWAEGGQRQGRVRVEVHPWMVEVGRIRVEGE